MPISSVPAKEKIAIWKPAKNPSKPLGNTACLSRRLPSDAVTPVGETNELPISNTLTPISVTTAMSLMIANQNSTSPNNFTVSTFKANSVSIMPMAGIQAGTLGNQYWKNPPTTTASPTTATLQLNQ